MEWCPPPHRLRLFSGRGILSDPKEPKAESEHPHADEHVGELHGLPGFGPSAGPNPLHELGLHASTDEFHFSGPMEELDFTEPADFTFPTGPDGSAIHGTSVPHFGHSEAEGLFGGEQSHEHQHERGEGLPHEGGDVHDGIVDTELATDDAVAVEEAAELPKPKRQWPKWLGKAEWAAIIALPVIAVVANIAAIGWLDATVKRWVLNISCPVLLLLIPYAMWRCKERWNKPIVTASYTAMMAMGTAMLIAGTWFLGTELSKYNWEIGRAKVRAAASQAVADK